MMRILLQRLDAGNNWQPFSDLAATMRKNTTAIVALVIRSASKDLPAGHCRLVGTRDDADGAMPEWLRLPTNLPGIEDAQGVDAAVLCWRIVPWPRLLLLGAGPDALPLVNLARTLGWETTLADHRPHYLQSGAFGGADRRVLVEPAELGQPVATCRLLGCCRHEPPPRYRSRLPRCACRLRPSIRRCTRARRAPGKAAR